MTAALFVVAAGAGAMLRHTANRTGRGWLATLAINVAGAFVLGMLVASHVSPATRTVLGTGLCGALTTFSGLALEVTEASARQRSVIVAASLALGLLAAAAGYAVG